MFHLVSAFEAFISNNWTQKRLLTKSGIYFMDGDAFMVIGRKPDMILVRLAMLSNLPEEKIEYLGIDPLFNIFNWDDWIVFQESAEEELDSIIYCAEDGKAYSVGACLEEDDSEKEDEDAEESDLRKAELEHAMSEAEEWQWRE